VVLLIGPSGAGKSRFALRAFPEDAIVSSDAVRRSGGGTKPARAVEEEMERIVEMRLAAGLPTVVDATNSDWMRRAELIRLAQRHNRRVVGIVFNIPLDECLRRNAVRADRVAPHVIRRQAAAVQRDLDRFDLEGFSTVHIVSSPAEVDALELEMKKGPVTRAPIV
jgi:protein phosphatase